MQKSERYQLCKLHLALACKGEGAYNKKFVIVYMILQMLVSSQRICENKGVFLRHYPF
jgi:hypothetical protein